MKAQESRKGVLLAIILLAVGVTALAWYFRARNSAATPGDAPAVNVAESAPVEGDAAAHPSAVEPAPVVSTVPPPNPAKSSVVPPASNEATPRPAAVAPAHTAASPYARSLVRNLSEMNFSNGAVTPEQAAAWQQEYKKLVAGGADSVQAIRELLAQNINIDFAGLENGSQLGAHSLRDAMFDALQQIGGQDAISLAAEVMQTTANPAEIAALAARLQAMAPGEYSEASLAAARNALARAGAPGAATAADMSPVFEMLQKLGGANALSDLQQAAAKWNYYAPIAIASLPDGSGVPALAQMAASGDVAGSAGSRLALRLLAQMAGQYPDAAQALLNEIGGKGVPEAAWPGIAAALGGEQTFYGQGLFDTPIPTNGTDPKGYHLANNNQNYRSLNTSVTWTPAQVQQHIAVIDQLAAANPIAGQKLAPVRAVLVTRLNQ